MEDDHGEAIGKKMLGEKLENTRHGVARDGSGRQSIYGGG
jgi:hypothetical protein